jgi:hypothetical protein
MKNLTLTLGLIVMTSLTISAQRANSSDRPGNRHGNTSYHNNHNGHHNNHNGHHNNHNGHHNNHNGHHNNHYGHHNNQNGHHNNHYGHNNNHYGHYNNHYGYYSGQGFGHYACNNYGWAAVCATDFNLGYNSIRHYAFDRDRLTAANRFARNHHLTVKQVRKIIHMFTFESTKLKFAKYAFGRTCDVENYHLVFDCLTFNSSRRELDRYINNHYY